MMQRKSTNFISVSYRLVSVAVWALAAITIFFTYAERSSTKEAIAQPSALGKLAFDRMDINFSGMGYISIRSSNSDGSGVVGLAVANVPPLYCNNASWKRDGTKIVYEFDNRIWTMNADGTGKVNLTSISSPFPEKDPSWSISDKIAFVRESQIWTMNSDGTAQALFAAITRPSPNSPAYSPDGTKLAFQSETDIWVINTDGTGERRVTNNGATNFSPDWSPDGTKIIYAKSGSGIAVINLDGTNETPFTNWGQDGSPSWSNDGTKIAFVRRGTTVDGIYTMDAEGNHELRILADNQVNPGRTIHGGPAWQPVAVNPNTSIISGRVTRNGESLAGVTVNLTGSETGVATTNAMGEFNFGNLPSGGSYTVTPTLANHIFTPIRKIFNGVTTNQIADFAGGQTCSTPGCKVNGKVVFVRGSDIYTSNADGTGVVNLTNGSLEITEEPSFSPDGNFIVFRGLVSGDYEIYRMTSTGTNITRLTNVLGEDEDPVYSPDGSKIAFVSDRHGNLEIYTMNSDGTGQTRLTNNSFRDGEPSYSPDGTKIVFNRGVNGNGGPWQLFTMNSADGSGALQITTPGQSILDMTPSYSPDGSKIIFTRYDTGPFTSVFMTVSPDGSGATTLPLSGFIRKASYSPDGTKIIYTQVGLSGFPSRVGIYPLAGGSTQLIVDGYNADWQPVSPQLPPTNFDFDGDGKADIAVFRPSEGVWYILRSSDSGLLQRQFAVGGDLPVPSDFDGDSKTDIAIYRPSNGDFWSLNSTNSQQINLHVGENGDIALPSDIDGDRRSDYVVYKPSSRSWYRIRSSNGVQSTILFGAAGDKPLIGDFDGDGKSDPAIFRPSDGNWWWYSSVDQGQRATRWGIAEDIPSPADFDGDGKTDFAVFRPSTGVWYINNSSTGTNTIFPFGSSGDKPVPADYDGDGRADAAVYRPSDGTWYLLRSTAGFTGVRWGIASDVPVPNAFIR